MIVLYLDEDMREQLLNYDFEHSERCYDDVMYYMTNTESQILYDIIYSIISFRKDILERMGFKQDDLEIIEEYDVNIKFTNKKELLYKTNKLEVLIMVNRIVKGFVNGYCKKNNLILLNIHEKIFERITDEGHKFNDSYYVIDCMNEENKFLKFKITETIKSINNELYCEVKAIRI